MPRTTGSSASSSTGQGCGRGLGRGLGRGYRSLRGRASTRENIPNSSSRPGFSVRLSPTDHNSTPPNSDLPEPSFSHEEQNLRSDSELIQHETVMAMDMKDNSTIGCAYFSTTDGILQVSEDIPTASLNIAEQFLIHVQPNSLLVSARAPTNFRDYLEKLTTSKGKWLSIIHSSRK